MIWKDFFYYYCENDNCKKLVIFALLLHQHCNYTSNCVETPQNHSIIFKGAKVTRSTSAYALPLFLPSPKKSPFKSRFLGAAV